MTAFRNRFRDGASVLADRTTLTGAERDRIERWHRRMGPAVTVPPGAAMPGRRARAAAGRATKSLTHVAALAQLLGDLGLFEQDIGVEAGDDAVLEQITAALQALGEALLALTAREVQELVDDAGGAQEAVAKALQAALVRRLSFADREALGHLMAVMNTRTRRARAMALKSAVSLYMS